MVRPARATRRRVPGGSSIWPKTSAVFSRTPRLVHLRDEVVALTGALTDAREDGDAVVEVGDTHDHFLDQHGLADTGTTEQTDLAALDVRGEKVDDLQAGLEHLGLGLELVERRGLAVDGPALGPRTRPRRLFSTSTEGVEHLALGEVADRDADARARVGHRGLADQTVGGLHRDRADQAVTQVLGDLQGQRLLLAGVGRVGDLDVKGVVDLRHGVDGEFHVDDRADDPGDAARGNGRLNCGRHYLSLPAVASARAAAPPTISLISWVISAWRAALASRESVLIRSPGVVGRRLHRAARGGVLGGGRPGAARCRYGSRRSAAEGRRGRPPPTARSRTAEGSRSWRWPPPLPRRGSAAAAGCRRGVCVIIETNSV